MNRACCFTERVHLLLAPQKVVTLHGFRNFNGLLMVRWMISSVQDFRSSTLISVGTLLEKQKRIRYRSILQLTFSSGNIILLINLLQSIVVYKFFSTIENRHPIHL